MKIAIFTDVYLDLGGGIVGSISAQKNELERLGHTVYLFTTGFKRGNEEKKRLAKEHIFIVPSCKLFFRPVAPLSHRPAIIEKWLQKNFPELKDFDVFHVHYEAGCSIAGVRLGKKYHIPIVQTMHGREDSGEAGIIPHPLKTFVAACLDWFHSWYLPHDTKIKRDQYLATTIARTHMWSIMVNHANMADIVITPSEHFKQKLLHYGVKAPIKVVPNAVKDEDIPEKNTLRTLKSGETLRMIWHSRLSNEKRLMEFLEALKYLKGNYSLDVFGDGAIEIPAKAFVKTHRLKVNFCGLRSMKDLMNSMKDYHLDIMASYSFDTFAMTLIEAETTGLPVFFCDPEMKEIVPEGSYAFAEDPSPKGIAKELQYIVDNPDLIKKMSAIMLENRDEVKQSERIRILLKIYDKIKA